MGDTSSALEMFEFLLGHRGQILAVERWSREEDKMTMQPPFRYDHSDPIIRDKRFVPSPCTLEPLNQYFLSAAWSDRKQELFEDCVGVAILESARLRSVMADFGTQWKNAASSFPTNLGIKSLAPAHFLEPYEPGITLRLHELAKSKEFSSLKAAESDHQIAFTIGYDEGGQLAVTGPQEIPSLVERGFPVYEGDELLERFGKPVRSSYRASVIAERGMTEYVGRLGLTEHRPAMSCVLCGQDFWPQELNGLYLVKTGVPRYCADCHGLRSDVWRKVPIDEDSRKAKSLRAIELVSELTGLFPFKNLKRQVIGHLEPEERDRWFMAQVFMPDRSAGELFGSWDQMLSLTTSIGVRPRKGRGGYVSTSDCGHVCYSLGERTICDFLSSKVVEHEKEPVYPNHSELNPSGKLRADWLVQGIWVELAGYPDDTAYMKKMAQKQELAKVAGLKHLVVMPTDLKQLDTTFRDAGVLFQ